MTPDLTALLLARIQFAGTVGFHIVLPALSIGLASYLLVLEALWRLTGRDIWLDLYRYWLKVFAIGFAMGVVSGLVMSYEFGTNWAVFSDKVGPVVGPLMGYEVMTAFFLEAGFLGVMLFGIGRVAPLVHLLATAIVALGTLLSAFWILAVNSWMQTPAGYVIAPDGRFLPADWWAVIFNPSFPYRLVHMVLASFLAVAFLVGGVGAWHLLRRSAHPAARLMFSMALWMATFVAPLQILAGDAHGLNTLAHQPAKIAALEGDFVTRPGTPLLLFGLPDMKAGVTRYPIEIPHLGALVLTHDWNGTVPGLDQFAPADRPYAPALFFSFRLMVGLGLLMAALGLASLWARWRGSLYEARWLQWPMVAMAPSGFVALLAGWVTTEMGRQPWTVYGLLRTADSASPIATPGVAASLLGFALVYGVVFGAGLLFLLRLMAHPPASGEAGPPQGVPIRSAGLTPAAAVAPHVIEGRRP